MSVTDNGSSRRERVRIPNSPGVTIGSPLRFPEPISSVPFLEHDGIVESSRSSLDKGIPTQYDTLIFEALSSMDISNGLDANAIHSFIEQRYELPQNFKRSLVSKLRRLVARGKLEKVDNRYKIKPAPAPAPAPSGSETPEPMDPAPNNGQEPPHGSVSCGDRETLEDASSYATYAISRSENELHAAAEADKAADRLAAIAEKNMVMLQVVQELYEQCLRDGMVLVGRPFKK